MSEANEVWAESADAVVVNSSGVSTEMVAQAFADQHPEIASLMRWSQQVRRGGLFERDRFLTPKGIFDQMRVAQEASELDDVVSGVLESTEALAFNRMSISCDDQDEEDIWNQILDDIDLNSRIREMWRELFTVSQFYVACWWDVKSYKVRGRSKQGIARKKQFNDLRVPVSITLLDPLKVVPVGNFMFNQEQLAWIATREEASMYDNVLSGAESDETISRLLVGRYEPTRHEQQRLAAQGVSGSQLYLLNPQNVWRLTSTRPQYKPFADVRMKSVFELLDLKNLLREMDRAHLLGATNFIVLVRKGSDNMPAKNEELSALQQSVRTLSRVPVIVGDHRLSIEIVTPRLDMSLQPEKYNTIDARITARLYQMFMTGNYSAGAKGDDSMKLVRIVARGLEARRSQIRRSIEREILLKIWERNEGLIERPSLEFHPKSVAIDFDPGLAAFFEDLLDRKHISRSTVLEQIDLDIDEEARKRMREAEMYDDVFNSLTPLPDPQQTQEFILERLKVEKDLGPSPAVPEPDQLQQQPQNADPRSAGRSGGGNRGGGGAAPGTGQGQPRDPRRGNAG